LHFGSLRDFPKCDFLSAPSFFLKHRRRMRGMKVGVVPLTIALLNLPKGKSLGRSKPATNS
jgi:hypothetical protein